MKTEGGSGAPRDLVACVLRDAGSSAAWSAADWDLFVRQARRAGLLARIASKAQHDPSWPVPDAVRGHFASALQVARAQHLEVAREVDFVAEALDGLGVPLVLLKGAAYLKAGLPAAEGRLFSDTDIMVPKARLREVEDALLRHGWATTHHSAYDDRYYREWMHELPPLVHLRRQTALDVHHAIAPETARVRPDSRLLLAAAVELPAVPGVRVLAPADMVLHSILHLLVNDDLSHTLRDLSDVDLLLRHFGAEPGFWQELPARARLLGLGRMLHYALTLAAEVLATPVPAQASEALLPDAPAGPLRPLMHGLFRQACRAPHPSTAGPWTATAQACLYLRAHWLRMPALLLARHLTIKALRLNEDKPKRLT